MLKKRIITAVCAIPLVVLAVWFDTPISWFTILAVIVGLLAAFEFYRLTGVIKAFPLAIFGMAGILYLIITPVLKEHLAQHCFLVLIIITVISLLALLLLRTKENIFSLWSLMLGGVLYIGCLLFLLVSLRLEPGTMRFPEIGRNLIFLTLLVTFASDTAAYFIGKTFGRHKLAPQISPGKTWEGAAGGVIGAIVVSLLFTLDTPLQLGVWRAITWWQAVLLGLAISIFGQLGDLVESLLKRSYKVKDSGNFMPGHGGILDRIDSILFAGIVVYLAYIYFMR